MSTTTAKQCTTAHVHGDIFLDGRCVHFGDVPAVMPSADEYAQGMKKLRATANCPVLSPESELLAQELATYPDLNVDTPVIDDLTNEQLRAAKKRKSVAEFLKAQHREDLLKRLPRFEQWTHDEIRELQSEVSSLSFRLLVTNILLLLAIAIGGAIWLF